jgi:hypothetical protein
MASWKIPGYHCSYRAPEDIADGTTARACAPRPGPVRESDAWPVRVYARRSGYVHEALTGARVGYAAAAVLREVGEDGYEVLGRLLPDLVTAAEGVVMTGGLGAVVGGAASFLVSGQGAAAGAVAGAPVGLIVGEGLLAWLGLGLLVAHLRAHFEELGAKFERAILQAWQSQGEAAALDGAARESGEAVGFFVRLLLQALVLFLDASTGKGGPGSHLAWGRLRDSLLFQRCRRLEPWLVEDLPKLRARWDSRFAPVTNEGGVR